jgi:hemin uptake protein HemP
MDYLGSKPDGHGFRGEHQKCLQIRMIRINMRAMESVAKRLQVPQPNSRPVEGRVLNTEQLFKSVRSLIIEHGGERYVLSLTRNGKLILTK